MEITEYLHSINPGHKTIIEQCMPIIEMADKGLNIEVGDLMGNEALIYKQGGEFKYAFASHPKFLSFHNMVMYCNPELQKTFKDLFKHGKFQKSCINFSDVENFDFDSFKETIVLSSQKQYPSEIQLKRKSK